MCCRSRLLLATCLASAFGVPAARAAPVILDFEPHFRGEIVHEQYLSEGMRITAANWNHGPDHAVIFDTLQIGESGDEDLEAPLDAAPGHEELGQLWPGYVLVLHEHHDCESGLCATPDDEGSRPAGWIEFEFAVPSTLHGMQIIDVNYESGEAPSQLVLFNEAGEVLASLDVPGVGGQGNWLPWQIERTGVSRARLYLPGDAAVDQLFFTPESTVNWPPHFESLPPVAVKPGETYRYRPVVRDAEGAPVQVHLVQAPEGMTVTANGEIVWAAEPAGEARVEIEAVDAGGRSARQFFTVHVTEQFVRVQDFEFPVGTILDDELRSDGLDVQAKNFSSGSDYAVVFDTEQPTGGDTDLTAPFEEGVENDLDLGLQNPGKVIVLHEEHDCDVQDELCAEPDDETTRPAGWIEFGFTQPAHVYSLDVFEVRGHDPSLRTVEFYDGDGELIPLDLSMPRTGENRWDRLNVDAGNIRRIRLNLDGDAAFDRLHYALIGDGEPENLKPRANDDAYLVAQDETLSVSAPGVLENDSDPEGDELVASIEALPSNGAVVLSGDGGFTYEPSSGFSGIDQFSYRANDGKRSDVATVEVSVAASAVPPTIEFFETSPSVVPAGDPVTLSWGTSNASHISIEPGFADLPVTGAITVQPMSTTTFILTAAGEDGFVASASRTVTVQESEPEPDPEPEPEPEPEPSGLVVSFYWPEEGEGVNWQRAPLVLDVIEQTVMGVDPESTEMTLNGQPLPVDCSFDGRMVPCFPTVDVPVGSHTATARIADYVGDYSNTVTLNFYVDLVPPPPLDPTKITVSSPNLEGRVQVIGAPGAGPPGNMVRIQGDSATGNDYPIASDGSFNISFLAEVGDLLRMCAEDGAGNFSEFVNFTVYTPAPVVLIEEPQEGDLLNTNMPEILIRYAKAGSGLDLSTLAIVVDGVNVPVSCIHDKTASQCNFAAPLAEGAANLTATIADSRGHLAEPASVIFTIDTTPPAPVTRDKVSVIHEAEGTVIVEGGVSATEPFTNVILAHSGIEHTVMSGPLGEFYFVLAATTGDSISISTIDVIGNRSAEEAFLVHAVPLNLTVNDLADGMTLNQRFVDVSGTHDGPFGTAINVNGHPAAVTPDGRYYVSSLPLNEGPNEITVEAAALGRSDARHAITVNVTTAGLPVAGIKPDFPEVPSPYTVNFTISFDGPGDVQGAVIDYDGDGDIDQSVASLQTEVSYQFQAAGLFHPQVWVFSEDVAYSATTVVVVHEVAVLDEFLKAKWTSLNDALLAGNLDDAQAQLSATAWRKYGEMYERILPYVQAGIPEYSDPQLIEIHPDWADYLVTRDHDAKTYGYRIRMMKVADGTWKIHSM